MTSNRINQTARRLLALAGAAILLGFGSLPGQSWAIVDCAQIPDETGRDSDGDGLTDFQECSGVTLIDGQLITPCPINADGTTGGNGGPCLRPDGKDVFINFVQAPGGLLSEVSNPFDPNPNDLETAYGIKFKGLSNLGVNVNQLNGPNWPRERTFISGSLKKGVRMAESLDTSSTILGNCQYGTPEGLDGCVVYSARTQNFIESACAGLPVVRPDGTPDDTNSIFRAYMTYLLNHETGHTLGGLTSEYNSRFGGYHYKPGAGFLMEQAVVYSTKGRKCTFYISPEWNPSLDAPAVRFQ